MCLGKASGYREPKENKTEKVSLLKPNTNFDRIKDMSVDELAGVLATIEANAACIYSGESVDYSYLKSERKKQWLEDLESEAEG